MTQLNLLKNIGKEMERKLRTIGINSAEELKKLEVKMLGLD